MIFDASGSQVVSDTYDAWGKPLNCTGGKAGTVGVKNPFRYRGYYYDTESGLYYLNSRYYDPVVGRFLNADSQISGVGGEILGYNMFAYGFNNPVNMDDQNGNWPKILKEIGARLKYVTKFVVRIVAAPFKAIKANVGMGIGIGAQASATVKGVKVGAGAVASITNSVSYDKGKFDIKNTTLAKAGFTVSDAFDVSYTRGKEHSFFDQSCDCNILHDSFVEQSKCVANKSFQQMETTIGFSVSAYLGLGAEVSLGLDCKALNDELIDIFTEPYVGYY